jgi:hypothetical protein
MLDSGWPVAMPVSTQDGRKNQTHQYIEGDLNPRAVKKKKQTLDHEVTGI